MSPMTSWFGIAMILFFAVDLVVVVVVLLALRRKNRYRGFEVIMKQEEKE